MAGFEWKYNQGGGRPLLQTYFAKNTETLTKGDIGNLDTGEVDLGATGDTALLGAIQGAFDPADEAQSGVITAVNSTTKIKIITNNDAVYSTPDANARNAGAELDLTGATGAQGLAGTSNNEFIVVQRKDVAAGPTLVKIRETSHAFAE